MAGIAKTEIVPVVPTAIEHHRELPAGSYHVILSGFMERLYVLRRFPDGTLYFVVWKGKGQMLPQFDLHADGSLEYDDPNDRRHP